MFSYFDEQFTFADDTILMYTGKQRDVVIPSSIRRYRVRKIGDNAFLRNTEITSVKIEEGIEELGDSLFGGCSSLKRLILPSTVEMIGLYNRQPALDEIIITQKMSAEELAALRERAFRTETGKYVIPTTGVPEETVRKAASLGVSLTPLLSDGSPLFSEKEFFLKGGGDRDRPEIWQQAGGVQIRSEREGAALGIQRGADSALTAKQEEDADWIFRNPNAQKNIEEKQAAAYFTEKGITAVGWSFLVDIHLRLAYYFRQHLQGVMLGTMYYVYSRYYAFPKGMYRADLAVLNADGMVVADEKKIEEVYGKYKLPSVF